MSGKGLKQYLMEKKVKRIKSKSKSEFMTTSYQGFKVAMDFVKAALNQKNDYADQITLLDYVLSAVKRDLSTDLLTTVIYSGGYTDKTIKSPFPDFVYDENGKEITIILKDQIKTVDLRKEDIILLPWNFERVVDNIIKIKNNEFWYDSNNHISQYYTYIDLCYVSSGNHSIGSGIVHGKGQIISKTVIDTTLIFPFITTDGVNWINVYSGKNNVHGSKVGDVFDFRVAVIYEVARMKYLIEKEHQNELENKNFQINRSKL